MHRLHVCQVVSKKTAQLSQLKSIDLYLVKQKNQAKEEEEQQYKKKDRQITM